jgi:hypothetical protein
MAEFTPKTKEFGEGHVVGELVDNNEYMIIKPGLGCASRSKVNCDLCLSGGVGTTLGCQVAEEYSRFDDDLEDIHERYVKFLETDTPTSDLNK